MRKKKTIPDDRWHISTAEMSNLFGVTIPALRKWVKNGCPQLGHGKWDLKAVLAWKRGIAQEGEQQTEAESMRERKLKAETLYREERARRERLQREILEGKYYPRGDVEDAWAGRCAELRASLLDWSKTLPQELLGLGQNEVERVVYDRACELLEQYSRDGTYTKRA